MLPARLDELDRTRLEIELRRRLRAIDALRDLLREEQVEQARIQQEVDTRLSPLRNDLERVTSEISRLEARLDRLIFTGKSVSDEDLDRETEDARAEEAAWWAEWRHKQSERSDRRFRKSVSALPDDIQMRRIYRAIARLVHPDRARGAEDKERREEVMRQANEAKESRDLNRLQQILASWAEDDSTIPSDSERLRARIAELGIERQQIQRNLHQLRDSALGRLVRLSERELQRHLRREESKLRRELALYRLRRRRMLRNLEERRQELSPSGTDN